MSISSRRPSFWTSRCRSTPLLLASALAGLLAAGAPADSQETSSPIDGAELTPDLNSSDRNLLGLLTDQDEVQPENAQETQPTEFGWAFEVTPVLWAAEVSGSGMIRGRSFDASASFSDIFSNLDAGGMLVVRAQKDRFGIRSAGMFVKMSQDARVGPLAPELDTKLAIAELYASYELASIPLGSTNDAGPSSTLGVDVYGGARYTYASGKLRFQGPLGVRVDQSQDWLDPVIGGSLRFDPGEQWDVYVQGDIGGFGVSSDFVWSVSARIDYHLSPRASVVGGYHLLDYDFDGALDLDAQLRGPFLGIAIRF